MTGAAHANYADPAAVLRAALLDGLRPDPDLAVDEWADRYRILVSESSSEPGPWRTDRFPFLREPMQVAGPRSGVELIVMRFASQLGKTEMVLNTALCYVDVAPGPMMWLMPDENVMRRTAEQRLDPAIRACSRLHAKLPIGTQRKAGQTILSRTFPGGMVWMGSLRSASGLASMPVRYLLIDEVDRAPASAGHEGDPVDLARKRTENFPGRKIILISSPTVAGVSRIDTAIEETDDRRYLVPCPHCGACQELVFSREFASGGIRPHGRLVWQGDDPDTAQYECGHCEALIDERHKGDMLAAGFWQASRESTRPAARGYHLNGLYTPPGFKQTWAEIARKFLAAHKRPENLKVFVNTVLAESWSERGQAPEYERLYERRERYPIGTAPAGVLVVTAGVDVQADRLEYEVVGWAENLESWSIEFGVLPGDPHQPAVWADLEQRVLQRTFTHETGGAIGVTKLAIDTGYASNAVYDWVRRQNPRRVIATKGEGGRLEVAIAKPTAVDIKIGGRVLRNSVLLWRVGTHALKPELYSWLHLAAPNDERPDVPGFCHFPEYDLAYFQGLTAETLVRRRNRTGHTILEWVKIRERNEPLDCRILARAAFLQHGCGRWRPEIWAELRAHLASSDTLIAPAAPPPAGGRIVRKPRVAFRHRSGDD